MAAHQSSRLSGHRSSDIAAVVVAIFVILALAFALRPQNTPTTTATSSAAQTDRPSAPDHRKPSVLFIGDSYTAGNGVREMSPGCMAAVRMGWLCQLSAVPGTGYISGGPANRFTVDDYVGPSTSFSERIPGLAARYHPDIVVLDGGRNDLFPPKEDVLKAMAATVAEARRAWPTATLVVVRPRYLDHPDDDLGFDDAFISRLLGETGTENIEVIDPVGRFTGLNISNLLAEDERHLNEQGQHALADAFVDAFQSRGFAVTT